MAYHQTLHPDVRGYIDELTPTKVKGWAFHFKDERAYSLRVQGTPSVEIIIKVDRDDVSASYKLPTVTNCGWEFSLDPNAFCALQMLIKDEWVNIFAFNENIQPQLNNDVATFIVADNFYADPNSVRNFALSRPFIPHPEYHKGNRTEIVYRFPGLKERFEQLIGRKIKNWEGIGTNCCFQYCIAGDQLVYHHDLQDYAGVLYLTPDAPPQAGTNLYRSKHTKKMKVSDEEQKLVFKNGYLDSTEFDLVDVVGNVYNRLILFDSKVIHAASAYFGTNKENGRLFQLFFFDIEN